MCRLYFHWVCHDLRFYCRFVDALLLLLVSEGKSDSGVTERNGFFCLWMSENLPCFVFYSTKKKKMADKILPQRVSFFFFKGNNSCQNPLIMALSFVGEIVVSATVQFNLDLKVLWLAQITCELAEKQPRNHNVWVLLKICCMTNSFTQETALT